MASPQIPLCDAVPPSFVVGVLAIAILQSCAASQRGRRYGRPSGGPRCRAFRAGRSPKNTNKAYDPKQREWRVSSPSVGDVRQVAGRPRRSPPFGEIFSAHDVPLPSRNSAPRRGSRTASSCTKNRVFWLLNDQVLDRLLRYKGAGRPWTAPRSGRRSG
jgi:hypothetical protein